MPTQNDLIVQTLGPCQIESPLKAKGRTFVDEMVRVRVEHEIGGDEPERSPSPSRRAVPARRSSSTRTGPRPPSSPAAGSRRGSTT